MKHTLTNVQIVTPEDAPDTVIVKNEVECIYIAKKTPQTEANARLIYRSAELLENMKEVMSWGKTKNGKFTFTTSEEQAEEFKKLLGLIENGE